VLGAFEVFPGLDLPLALLFDSLDDVFSTGIEAYMD